MPPPTSWKKSLSPVTMATPKPAAWACVAIAQLSYIIRRMRGRAGMLAVGVLALVAGGACGNPLGPQYEYEEQVYLKVNGGASITINASIPALVALRGAALDPSPSAR